MTVSERIKIISTEKKISENALSLALELSRNTISQIISKDNKPSYDVIVGLANKYPDISLDWLILGRGEMYRTAVDRVEEASPVYGKVAPLYDTVIESLRGEIAAKDKVIALLEQKNT